MSEDPDRFDKQGAVLARAWADRSLTSHAAKAFAAALRAAESSALERAAQIADQHESRLIANSIRALIPPAAAPKTQRDAPCGGCGHPLWWHQWNSKEHAFCCAPLDELQRDYCRCKNYEKPAAAPAGEPRLDNLAAESPAPAAETGKAQGAEALTRCIAGQRETLHAAGKRIAELEALVAEANRQLAALTARTAPPEGEGT